MSFFLGFLFYVENVKLPKNYFFLFMPGASQGEFCSQIIKQIQAFKSSGVGWRRI